MKKLFLLIAGGEAVCLNFIRFFISRRVIFSSVLILAVSADIQSVMANTNTSNSFDVKTVSEPKTPEERMSLFRKAVDDDLSGHHKTARKIWDVLVDTDMAAHVAVPSAINLVALGKFDEASKAFDAISVSHNAHERDYAHLWQLWLTARTYVGKPTGLKNELAILASGMKASSPNQQALIRLYSGKGTIDEVFALIAAMPGTDELQRRDALTEATFFAGGFQQYVARDGQAALQLYEREQNQMNSTSLERPLINKATENLQAAKK